MKVINCLVLLFCGLVLQAQTTPTNIKEVFTLETDCPLDEIIKGEVSEQVLEEMTESSSPPPPPPPPPGATKPVPPPPPSAVDMSDYITKLAKYARKRKLSTEIAWKDYAFFRNEDFLWGLKNEKGKILIEPTFDHLRGTHLPNVFIGTKDGTGKYNVYNLKGDKLFANAYDKIDIYENREHIFITDNGKTGWAKMDGTIYIPVKYESIRILGEEYLAVKMSGKSGVLTKEGQEVLPIKYKDLHFVKSDDGQARFMTRSKGGQVVLIDLYGKETTYGIPYSKYSDGGVLEGGRYFYYNRKLIDLQERVYVFCGKKIKKSKLKKHPILSGTYYTDDYRFRYAFDETGKIIPELTNNVEISFREGIAVAKRKTEEKNERGRPIYHYGMMDEKLNWIVEPNHLLIKRFSSSDEYLVVKKDKSAGVLDSKGEVVIPFDYSDVAKAGEKYLVYSKSDPDIFDILDKEGKKLASGKGKFNKVGGTGNFHSTYRQPDRKRVILDKNFREIYDEKFNNLDKFGENGIALETFVSNGKEYKIIDLEGNPVSLKIDKKQRDDYISIKKVHRTPFFHIKFSDGSNCIYDTRVEKAFLINAEINYVGDDFYRSTGLLSTGKEYRSDRGLIDTLGREIIPPMLNYLAGVSKFSGAYFKLNVNKNSRLFTMTGEELFTEYEGAAYLKNHYFMVKKNDKWGVVTAQQKEILPCEYSSIKLDRLTLKAKKEEQEFIYTLQGKLVE